MAAIQGGCVRYKLWHVSLRVTIGYEEQVAMRNNFHIRMKNAINRVSARPRPTSLWCPPSAPCGPLWLKMSGFLEHNQFATYRTLSFSAGPARFLRPSIDKTTDFGPYGTTILGEKRIDLSIYTDQMMIYKFGKLLPELLNHCLARIDI